MSQCQILNNWLSITLTHISRFMPLNVCDSLATFGNTPKVDIKATMNEKKIDIDHSVQWLYFQKKKKSILIIMYNGSTFKRKRKEKEIWYQIKGESSCVVYRSTRPC